MNGWEKTEFEHNGRRVYRNQATGELAAEIVQEARLVELPRHIEMALRDALDLCAITRTLKAREVA